MQLLIKVIINLWMSKSGNLGYTKVCHLIKTKQCNQSHDKQWIIELNQDAFKIFKQNKIFKQKTKERIGNKQFYVITTIGSISYGKATSLRSSMSARKTNPYQYPYDTELTILDFPTCNDSAWAERNGLGIFVSDIIIRNNIPYTEMLVRLGPADPGAKERIRAIAFYFSRAIIALTKYPTFATDDQDNAATGFVLQMIHVK